MTYLYSPTTRGFYSEAIHGEHVPSDVVMVSDAEHAELMAAQAAGKVIHAGLDGVPVAADLPEASLDQVVAAYGDALDASINAGARSWGYDSLATAASYAASAVPRFKAEAKALIAWRDKAWLWASDVLDAIKARTRPPYESAAAFVAEAPAKPDRPA